LLNLFTHKKSKKSRNINRKLNVKEVIHHLIMDEMPIFKSKTLQEPGPKKRMWKSLKQIQTNERNLYGLNSDAVICEFSNIYGNSLLKCVSRALRFIDQRTAFIPTTKEILGHLRINRKLLRSSLEALLPQHRRISNCKEDAQ
jgi:hypothetical protein